MVENAGSPKTRALIACICTSGLRNSSLRALLFKDVKEELERGTDSVRLPVDPEMKRVDPDASFVAVGNGSGIYLLDDHGDTLWTHDIDHTISSISISSDGRYIAADGWQTLPGPAGIYANGEVYLFDSSSGKLL